ncbi:MAG TPA: 30S ribosome-binding factor RbfA [Burkholderiaceae bacterium]|nr:30S ribosome-binding factor RbfA [Burkholderiaceae bacterium]
MVKHKPRSVNRNVRLADQIQKDLASLIQREFDVAQVGLVTVSGVELSTDYAHARVYFTVLGAEPAETQEALNEKAGMLHGHLFKMLRIHTVPVLHFVHDDHVSRGVEMSRLIDEAMQSDARFASSNGSGD